MTPALLLLTLAAGAPDDDIPPLAVKPAKVAAQIEPAPVPPSFEAVVKACAADAKALPAGLSLRTRYLDLTHLVPAELKELRSVLAYHVNGLSRESKRTAPREVVRGIYAVRLDDYRWSEKTWETLASANHYYAIKVTIGAKAVKKTRTVNKTDGYGRLVPTTEEYEEKAEAVESFIPAPWLPAADMAELVTLTGSATPIIRGDEFLFQTGIQVDRKGHGYYDFLAFTKKADAAKLAALDEKKAIEVYRELGAIVPVSGVALNNRQVFRFATITGAWWETHDVLKGNDKQNAVANLLEDFKPDAEEIVFTLPNGLPGYYLSNGKGEQQDSVPDAIASDHRSTNNDRRIHVGYSCITCHIEGGLRPIRDYARKLYSAETGVKLATLALDPEKARRLESVYLGPLEKNYKRDVADLGEAIADAASMKFELLPKAYERQWSRYIDEPVTLEKAAAECRVTPDDLRTALRRYAAGKGVIDPVLISFVMDDPPPVRREAFEERFGVLMLVLKGVSP